MSLNLSFAFFLRGLPATIICRRNDVASGNESADYVGLVSSDTNNSVTSAATPCRLTVGANLAAAATPMAMEMMRLTHRPLALHCD